MVIFTLKSTGETIVLPTPDGKPVDIETLPTGEPLSEEQIKEYLKFADSRYPKKGYGRRYERYRKKIYDIIFESFQTSPAIGPARKIAKLFDESSQVSRQYLLRVKYFLKSIVPHNYAGYEEIEALSSITRELLKNKNSDISTQSTNNKINLKNAQNGRNNRTKDFKTGNREPNKTPQRRDFRPQK